MSLALRELGLRAVRPPLVPAAAAFMPEAAILHAPAVRQREHAPDLTEDRLPLPPAVLAAVRRQPAIPVSTASKRHVTILLVLPAPRIR